MKSSIRTHISHNVVGYIALFLSLTTGTAWAAATIGSDDVIDNSLRSRDLKNGAAVKGADVVDEDLTAADLAALSVNRSEIDPEAFASGDIDPQSNGYGISPNAIQSSEIEDGQVTGADVLESSLGQVPNATHAQDVNGVNVYPIEFLRGAGSGLQTVLSRTHGLRIRAECTSGGDLEVIADTDRNARLLTWSIDAGNDEADNTFAIESFATDSFPDLVNEDDGDQSGQTVYMTSGGAVVIVNWAADNNTTPAFGTQCAFVGTATAH